MIRLFQEFGAHAGRRVTFDQERVRLGRAPTNDVAFDPNVDLDASGNHCEIVREHGQYVVVDVGSRNGTFVNEARVTRRVLAQGDLIECGRGGPRLRVELAVAAGGAQPAAGSSPAIAAPPPGVYPAYATPPPPSAWSVPPPAPSMPPPPIGSMPPPPLASVPPPPAASIPPPPRMASVPPSPHGAPPAVASVGAAVAAQLPPGAQVGKRTLAILIDQAVARSAPRTSPGVKLALGLTIALLLAGFVAGGYALYAQRREHEARLAELGRADTAAGERIARENEGAIYLIAAGVPGGAPRGFCTGFAVTSDLIATNAHCVELAQQQIAQGRVVVALRNNGGGGHVVAQPVYRDPRFHDARLGLEGSGFDVGLLRAAQALPSRVRLASDADAMGVRSGAQVYVYGFPANTMNEASPVATITAGIVNRVTDFFDRAAPVELAQKLQHTAQTSSGSSGSPVFLGDGAVVAVNAGSLAVEERENMVDPRTGQRVNVAVGRSSSFKYGMRADLIRQAIQAVGEAAP